MNSSLSSEVSKHEMLQGRLSAVHEDLRKQYKKWNQTHQPEDGPDAEIPYDSWLLAWKSHTKNIEILDDYSKAMYELATEIWAPKYARTSSSAAIEGRNHIIDGSQVKCRIEWVALKVKEHFQDLMSRAEPVRKLTLLDVGSCYNPFSDYEDIFDIVAIDLCPAPPFRNVIYQGDFLSVDIRTDLDEILVEEKFSTPKTLVALSTQAFDVIVFSFFLEYLPDAKQRLESCRRAYELLRPGGVLFILRPDSKSVTSRTMKLIKELKVALGFIGFHRLWCEKLEHLWGMGFLKVEDKSAYRNSPKFLKDCQRVKFTGDEGELPRLFSIPQDFHEEVNVCLQTSPNPADFPDPLLFDELPRFSLEHF